MKFDCISATNSTVSCINHSKPIGALKAEEVDPTCKVLTVAIERTIRRIFWFTRSVMYNMESSLLSNAPHGLLN